jgi:hypothetical protein
MNGMGTWITVGAALFAVRFVATEAAMEKPSLREGQVVFPPVLGVRVLFGLGIPMFLYGAAQVARGDLRQNWDTFVILAFFASAAFVLWPATIAIDELQITQSKWLGLRRFSIAWANVDYVFSIPAEGSVRIVDVSGRSITHTKYHLAPEAFKDLLSKYCKKYVPASERTEP